MPIGSVRPRGSPRRRSRCAAAAACCGRCSTPACSGPWPGPTSVSSAPRSPRPSGCARRPSGSTPPSTAPAPSTSSPGSGASWADRRWPWTWPPRRWRPARRVRAATRSGSRPQTRCSPWRSRPCSAVTRLGPRACSATSPRWWPAVSPMAGASSCASSSCWPAWTRRGARSCARSPASAGSAKYEALGARPPGPPRRGRPRWPPGPARTGCWPPWPRPRGPASAIERAAARLPARLRADFLARGALASRRR